MWKEVVGGIGLLTDDELYNLMPLRCEGRRFGSPTLWDLQTQGSGSEMGMHLHVLISFHPSDGAEAEPAG